MAKFEDITARMTMAVGDNSGLGKSLKLDMGPPGVIFIDGGTVSNEDLPADLVMTVSIDDLVLMGQGQLTAMSAVMSGRLQFSDLGLAMGLQAKLTDLFARLNQLSAR